LGKTLEGKNALVTGAGTGIGKEIAQALAAEGAKVVVNDLGVPRNANDPSSTPANETVEVIKALGGTAIASYDNVADHAATERMVKSCIDNFGSIDILVNVAGILREKMIWNMPEDYWDSVISVHLKGTFNTTRFACAAMREQQSGRIINTASDAWRGTMGQSNYGAAKGGIVSFSRAIAREMARFKVTCNVICPIAATRMTMNDEVKAAIKKRYEAGITSKEQMEESLSMAGPEFIPPIVSYLASDHASNISGKVFGCYYGRITVYSDPEPYRGIYRDHVEQGPWTMEELVKLVPSMVAGLPTIETPLRF